MEQTRLIFNFPHFLTLLESANVSFDELPERVKENIHVARLSPCPFCGSKDLTIYGLDNMPWVVCVGCGITAHTCPDIETAIATWNKRVKAEA
jgi:Lar family restriction alleviation protein